MASNNKLFGLFVLVFVIFVSLLYTNNLSIPYISTPKAYSSPTFSAVNNKMSLKSYIITLKEDVSDVDFNSVKSLIGDLGGEITNEFTLIKGFAAKLPGEVSALTNDDRILHVEEDREVHIV